MPQIQLKKIKINGTELHYLDIGKGVPVVLVHGGGATDYRTWTTVVERFAEGFHVIVPCLRYHYPNEWFGDGSDYSAITHAQDLAALIKTLRIAPAHIVGSSYGANIALVLARDFHDLVRSLVLAEPALYDWIAENMTAEEREIDSNNRKLIREIVNKGNYSEAGRLFIERVVGKGAFDRLPESGRQRIIDNVRILALPESIFDGTESTISREEAQAIITPTLLLRGDSSPKRFIQVNDELAKAMPGAKRALIPHAAHYLHGMNPQEFSNVVIAYLGQH